MTKIIIGLILRTVGLFALGLSVGNAVRTFGDVIIPYVISLIVSPLCVVFGSYLLEKK
jgi:hypothetical protein